MYICTVKTHCILTVMATVNYYIDKKKRKEDGTWRVSIRLAHKGSQKFLSTNIYVDHTQISKKSMEIKDEDTLDDVRDILKGYRKKLQALDELIDTYDSDELKAYLQKNQLQRIDYFEFARKQVADIKVEGTRKNAEIVLNGFARFIGEKLNINDIDLKMLLKYDKHLRTDRTVQRVSPKGTKYNVTLKACGDRGVELHMIELHKHYKEAMKLYNDRGSIMIPYDPFEKYTMPEPGPTEDRDLSVDIIRSIRDCPDIGIGRYSRTKASIIARDCFILGFYLMGMNSVDLYNIKEIKDGRINYMRAKTSSRRKDKAFISVKVEPEAQFLIDKYRDPTGKRLLRFHLDYTNHTGFRKTLNAGLKTIGKHLKLSHNPTFYEQRYSWPNIARNKCGISKDDVAMAMNHSSNEHKVTDIYLKKDWSLMDRANRKVLDYLRESTAHAA